ncbi:D-alanyl-D-alanine carboxypeptidase, partial [Escherichia coli]|nr:D-alanyl-D-alanine carboxypeptidase [Escherichia coli]
GAPSMTIERFWLLVDNLRARGVKEIKGNIIADRSHFDVQALTAAQQSDDEALAALDEVFVR